MFISPPSKAHVISLSAIRCPDADFNRYLTLITVIDPWLPQIAYVINCTYCLWPGYALGHHQSDVKLTDRCLIDVDPMVFAIWEDHLWVWRLFIVINLWRFCAWCTTCRQGNVTWALRHPFSPITELFKNLFKRRSHLCASGILVRTPVFSTQKWPGMKYVA